MLYWLKVREIETLVVDN